MSQALALAPPRHGVSRLFLGFNQFGAIAGIWSDTNSVNHGFIRNANGKITTFGAPGAGSGTEQGTGRYFRLPRQHQRLGGATGEYIDAEQHLSRLSAKP